MDTELLMILIEAIVERVKSGTINEAQAVNKIKQIMKDYDVAVQARNKSVRDKLDLQKHPETVKDGGC